jgi:hypothetical protein
MSAAKKKGAPKKRASGPSGQHTKPGIMLRATAEEFAAWHAAAAPETLTSWIRAKLNTAAQAAGYKTRKRSG